ncbi:hypothetical protein POM88_028304 [Heracleum sosnowskyi]|uniref:Uncharacterized protein n=1 Tax=Heracleum sosnowskyi TaxID=360622 RepID=A0AAD8IA06_9APIA|nr:hypothetical protein POM88_028304 [Heracleum sosnowskyi]
MNATTDHSRVDVLSVAVLEFPMHITARSVHSKRKIGMGVLRLRIWGVQRRISSTNERNMVLKNDDINSFLLSAASSPVARLPKQCKLILITCGWLPSANLGIQSVSLKKKPGPVMSCKQPVIANQRALCERRLEVCNW